MTKKVLIRQSINDLDAYRAEYLTDGVKLDAMENPWSPIDFSDDAIYHLLKNSQINRYPDSEQRDLRLAVSQYFNIPSENLLFGHGSDEIIQLLTMVLGNTGDYVLSVTPSFSVYRIQAIANDRRYVELPLEDDFSLNVEAMLGFLEKYQPVITFIAYPNNPTGNLFAREDIERIIENSPGIVVLDEAYYAFAEDTFIHCWQKYPRLLIMRSFSKIGFAGLRVGMLVGQASWLEAVNKARLPYNIDTLSQLLLATVFKQPELFEASIKTICQQRQDLYEKMESFSDHPIPMKVFPSQANFLLFQIQTAKDKRHKNACAIHRALHSQKIYIKNLSKETGLLSGCLRVSIGTQTENRLFLEGLNQVVNDIFG